MPIITPSIREICKGLRFPEGPVVLPDGAIVLVEIAAQRLSRVGLDGARTTLSEIGGGPNGAALGPDGFLYVCNNGGMSFGETNGVLAPRPVRRDWPDYGGGRIERVDPRTGKVEVLFRDSDKGPLRAPNDLVIDAQGGIWFTDHGRNWTDGHDRGALCYITPDRSACRRVASHLNTPNGVGLSPDGQRVYVAETETRKLLAFDVAGPGRIAPRPYPSLNGAALVAGLPGGLMFDSLAVEAGGNVVIATVFGPGLVVIAPDGTVVEEWVIPGDAIVTNICFGGHGMKTAYVTLSGTGRLIALDWPRPGLRLAA